MTPNPPVREATAFGDLLREHRLARRMTQGTLAERARMSIEAISALERGFRRAPQRQTVALLAEALGLTGEDAARFGAAATGTESKPVPRRRAPARLVAPAPLFRGSTARLIGRDHDLATVAGLIRAARLVTICGTGGIGKTELALAVAQERFASGTFGDVRFVSLAPVVPGGSVDDAVARVFGVPAGADARALAETLSEQSALLVIDNCEHVAGKTATLLRALLAGCPHLAILATSRQALDIAGEAVYPLATLELSAAVSLFVERAREADPRFAVTEANAPIVADICRRLDGIALAVEIAARRTRSLSPEEIRSRLDRRFRLLVNDAAIEPRQQTVAALIDWSYKLLSAEQQRFFNRLSIFASGFTLEAARAIALEDDADDFDALDTLDSLIAKSLVVRANPQGLGETRYSLLETLRTYGMERLAETGDLRLAQARLLTYIDRLFAAAGIAFEQEARIATLARLDRESETFAAALDAADALGLVLEGARLFARIPALRRWLRDDAIASRSARYIEALEGRDEPSLLSYLWIRHGNALSRIDAPQSLPAFERALAYARSSGDAAAMGRALVAVALGTMRMHRFDDARDALDEAARLDTSSEARKEERHTRALLALYRGDAETAAAAFAAIADAERDLGNTSFEFDALHFLAEAHVARGAFDEALDAAALAEPLFGTAGPHPRAAFRSSLAAYECFAGDAGRALVAALEAIEIRPRDNVWPHAFRHAALALALNGDLETAATIDGFATDRMRISAFTGYATERIARERLEGLLTRSIDAKILRALRLSGARLSDDAARRLVHSRMARDAVTLMGRRSVRTGGGS